MTSPLTLAEYQQAAADLAAILPSDVPLTAIFEPSTLTDFPVSGASERVSLRRVGAQEVNLLLVVAESVVAPLAEAGLGFDSATALRSALEQVSAAFGEGITSDILPSENLFTDSSAVAFTLQAGAETRGWFIINIREVQTMNNESQFTPSAQSEEAAQTESVSSPVSVASSLSAQTPLPVSEPTPAFAAPAAPASVGSLGNMRLLYDVEMTLTAEIGRAKLPVRQVLDLTPGAIVELDRVAGSPADLMVNGHLVARGEVVVIDEDYGLRITEILDTSEAFA